jgi:hypothetical protein
MRLDVLSSVAVTCSNEATAIHSSFDYHTKLSAMLCVACSLEQRQKEGKGKFNKYTSFFTQLTEWRRDVKQALHRKTNKQICLDNMMHMDLYQGFT